MGAGTAELQQAHDHTLGPCTDSKKSELEKSSASLVQPLIGRLSFPHPQRKLLLAAHAVHASQRGRTVSVRAWYTVADYGSLSPDVGGPTTNTTR